MPRYRALRDFGSHLGNHYRGQVILLPDGDLPRGFAGLVEKLSEIVTKDVRPATARANDVLPEAGSAEASTPEAGSVPPASAERSEPEEPPSPASRAEAGLYDDKALRARKRP
jgi:hypothetical protein